MILDLAYPESAIRNYADTLSLSVRSRRGVWRLETFDRRLLVCGSFEDVEFAVLRIRDESGVPIPAKS